VFWGGDTKELNDHYDTPNQRFAFDFVGADDSGKTHKGEGKTNEDYYAFGREIIAPADGVVTEVINGVRDNVPGSMNPYSAVGNAVLIQHRDNEVSVMAHFKLDSIKVKVGDKVTRGQVLGLCGNSGNSSEPHLHYHLQNTPVIQDGTGIKCIFDKVTIIKDGSPQAKTNYSPVKGEIILAD
jgi:murein DD-endopeptidase MepM/ murein hydrolase activator NlpD